MTVKYGLIFIFLCSLNSCSSQDFHKDIVEEKSNSDFESVSHRDYCFYKNEKLGQCGFLSVSPSGKLALIQESSSGHLYVYLPEKKQKVWLTEEFIGLVDKASWSENEKNITVSWSDRNGVILGNKIFKIDFE